MLAIVFGICDKNKANKILNFIEIQNINKPYPVKVLHPPIRPEDFFRPFHFRPTEYPYLQEPGNYHNGGIWPMVGGFYILSLKKVGKEWRTHLKNLALANKLGKHGEWEFNEWLNSSGIPMGSAYQSWSAGMYIFAYMHGKGKIHI